MKFKVLIVLVLFYVGSFAGNRTIYYPLSFLDISSDPISGGLGNISSVSSSFYGNSGNITNPALFGHSGQDVGFQTSSMERYNGLYNSDLSFFYSLNDNWIVAYAYRGYTYHSFDISNLYHSEMYRSKDYYHKLSATRNINNNLSIGIGVSYISSDNFSPSSGYGSSGFDDRNQGLVTIAANLGLSYESKYYLDDNIDFNIQYGAFISNIGNKVSYMKDGSLKQFIPTTLGIGILLNPEIYLGSETVLAFDVAYQLSKLLVPTPPITNMDGTVIFEGKDNDVSAFKGMYQSFYDAPGGFEEEIHEIRHQFGLDARLVHKDAYYVSGRIGRSLEHETKGDRQYTTFGVGLGVYGFYADWKMIFADSYLHNKTWALSLGFRTRLDKLYRF